MTTPNQKAMTECFTCRFKRSVPGNCHIKCVKPAQIVAETGNAHGIRNGWFFYPFLYDPTWKTVECPHYEQMPLTRSQMFTLEGK